MDACFIVPSFRFGAASSLRVVPIFQTRFGHSVRMIRANVTIVMRPQPVAQPGQPAGVLISNSTPEIPSMSWKPLEHADFIFDKPGGLFFSFLKMLLISSARRWPDRHEPPRSVPPRKLRGQEEPFGPGGSGRGLAGKATSLRPTQRSRVNSSHMNL